jgi:hypothetical protein
MEEKEKETLKEKIKEVEHVKLDNPDMLFTENESLYDVDEQMKFYDAIPVEELNDKVRDEEFKDETKATSASERKYRKDK